MIERGGNNLGLRNYRIDRGAWAQTYNYCRSTKIIDIHIHRKPWEGQVWQDLIKPQLLINLLHTNAERTTHTSQPHFKEIFKKIDLFSLFWKSN